MKSITGSCHGSSVLPLRGGFRSEDPQLLPEGEMTLKVEVVEHGGMHAEKTPGRSSRFEALHLALSSSNHLVRVLGPIVLDVEKALAQAPNSVPGLLERGNIRRLKGDLEGACQDWEHIGRLAPGSKADLAARANLEHLETGQGVPPAKPRRGR